MIPLLLTPAAPALTPLTPATPATPATAPAGAAAGGGFAQQLQGAIGQMEGQQASASRQVQDLLQGKSQDLHASLIAVEKADLSFGLMLQLRNKAVAAYQEIANMAF